MRSRFAIVVGVSLAIVLGILFTRLLRDSRAVLIEEERERRHERFFDAATALTVRMDRVRTRVQELAGSAALQRVLGDAQGPGDFAQAVDAFRLLERELVQASNAEGVVGLRVVDADGRALAWAGEPTGEATGWGGEGSPVVQRARARGGRVVFDAPSAERLEAAAWVKREREAVVVVTVDARELWARVAQCAPDGACGVLDASGTWVWPPGGGPAVPSLSDRTVVEGQEVVGALRLPDRSLPDWWVVARVPVVATQRIAGELQGALVLAGVAVVLVLVLGLGGAEARAQETVLRQTLEATERQERFLQGVFDAITDVLVVVDERGTVLRANRVAKELHGKDLPGRAHAEAFAYRASDPAGLRGVFHDGQPRHEEVETERGWWEVARFPIFGPDGRVQRVVEVSRNVTHMRQLQAQLIETEKLSTLGEMAAGIAHEVNNPMGVITMFAQLLREEIEETLGAEAGALEHVVLIEEQAKNVGEIVKNLLRFARRSEGTRVPYHPAAAVDRAVAIVEHQKILRGIEVEREADEGARVVGDEGQLAQVVLNLVINAVHAMDGPGRLALRVRTVSAEEPVPGRIFGTPPEGERVWVQVADSGSGIPPEALDKIFEPFFTTKPTGKGTGLGLSVGFGIVRDQGGCIAVETEAGVGTTFTLDLPAAGTDDPGEEGTG